MNQHLVYRTESHKALFSTQLTRVAHTDRYFSLLQNFCST